MTTKSNKCSLFSTLSEPSVNRKDLPALTLVEPIKYNLELDPQVVLHQDNKQHVTDAHINQGINFF